MALKRILKNYNASQLLSELLQNADDAGSTEFKALLDERSDAFGRTSCLSEQLAGCQGAAIYQYNDAQFREDDFQSIQR